MSGTIVKPKDKMMNKTVPAHWELRSIQDIPLWHKNYFELKMFENPQMQKGALSKPSPPPNCLKAEASKRIQLPSKPLQGRLPIPGKITPVPWEVR